MSRAVFTNVTIFLHLNCRCPQSREKQGQSAGVADPQQDAYSGFTSILILVTFHLVKQKLFSFVFFF
jgi:hypothetical protein